MTLNIIKLKALNVPNVNRRLSRFKGKWTDEGLKKETVLGYSQFIGKERRDGT